MPDTFTNWLKFTPAGQVGYRRAYLDLPAFSYTGLVYAGASVIVAQFNFSASQNFILLNRPTKPTGVNYGLCIRYRVGETVYRYKLWTDDNFVLNDDGAPLYTNQLIKKNFVLEVWSLNGQTTAVQTSAIRMFSSIRAIPTDITITTDYALAIGAEFTDLSSIAPTLPATPSYRWTSVGAGTTFPWTDSITGAFFLDDGAGTSPTFEAPDATWLKGRFKFVSGSNRRLYLNLPSMTWDGMQMYIVASVGIGAPTRHLISMDGFLTAKVANTDKLRHAGWNTGSYDLTIPDSLPHIFNLSKTSGTTAIFGRIDELTSGGALMTPGTFTGVLPLQLANALGGLNNGELNIAEVLIFKDRWDAIGSDFDIAVLQYLRWYHFGEMPLPLTFNSGGSWLDNV